ncbi:oxidoreductase domain protein [Alkaliphilus metalliredigens QYMF]|uniref:Oxidoreductase domain protein n=1 Tax=Alkaliphilus metalliredigens (strain QYMF) TaxID=293826 RepID=A6TU56_ALKMQ|nr:oxidoreductase [Alkaliphilus metalliredigens]ABR49724.1 oxidoreductase domain protein [Alkaliphilus metalliredigens QYMF]
MKKLNVGMIGFGMSGRVFHGPMITSMDEFNFNKIVCSREATVKAARESYPEVQIISDVDELMADDTIDLIIVATPNLSHFKLAQKALLANKHVIVEKPFTVTSAEADELIELAKKQEKIVTVYQNRRWDSDFQTIKQVIENGLLGNIVEYEAHFDRFRNYIKAGWREEQLPGSGMLYDLGSHLIDQAQYLFGLPKEIRADIRVQRKCAKCDDNFELVLDYGQVKVTLKSGMLVREALPHFIVLGDQGSFLKYGMDTQEEMLKKGETPKTMENWGAEPESIWGTINTDVNGLHIKGKIESLNGDYRGFYHNVYKAIMGKEELIVKPEEARNTIKIIELAMKSNKEKRTIEFK